MLLDILTSRCTLGVGPAGPRQEKDDYGRMCMGWCRPGAGDGYRTDPSKSIVVEDLLVLPFSPLQQTWATNSVVLIRVDQRPRPSQMSTLFTLAPGHLKEECIDFLPSTAVLGAWAFCILPASPLLQTLQMREHKHSKAENTS